MPMNNGARGESSPGRHDSDEEVGLTVARGLPPEDRDPTATWELAHQFLADTADSKAPWENLLWSWASSHGLTIRELRELARAVKRSRR